MKRVLYIVIGLVLCLSVSAQNDTTEVKKDSVDGWQFTTVDSIGITRVKDQNRSGTCWSFSTLGFLESEVLRTKGIEVEFAPMYVVSKTLIDRATYTVRMYMEPDFGEGGSAYDVVYCMEHYGLVPKSAMPGIQYGWTENDTLPVHTELLKVTRGYINALKGMKKLSPVWRDGLQAVYDTYLGPCPEEFEYEGKKYTPQSWVKSLGLDANNYVSLTSYTHHPFYERFALEVPDNWRMDQMYNVPIDELMQVIDNALANGYTLAWAADVSEIGFTRKGIGVVPDEDHGADITGSDMAKWVGMKADQKKEELTKKPLPEKEITQEMRQQAYDNWETTDDHGMQIFGTAKDQNGKKYYMVKNSWGTMRSDYKGIWYVSEAYVRYKTNDIMVHKEALPKSLKVKLKLNVK